MSTSGSYTFTAIASRTLVANFALNNYAISLSAIPITGGTTSGGGVKTGGSPVTVIAAPNPGYAFANWTENGDVISSSSSYTFTATANRTLVANFAPNEYVIELTASPQTGGATSGGGVKAGGSSVTVTATPNSGYAFANWTENGEVVSSGSSYTFTAIANRTLVAVFRLSLPIVQSDSGFGVNANQFGFNINWTSGMVVVVDACTDLANPVWEPIKTNICTGSDYFFD